MKLRFFSALASVLLLVALATAQQQVGSAPTKIRRTVDGHPDLSGIWAYAVDLPSGGIKRESNGKVVIKQADLSSRRAPKGEVKGALPFTAAPAYKPEFQAKVKDLFDHESKTDPVFYCGRPGVPRIGSPRKIVQMPNEIIFFYEDMSGDTYRVIPTDGRPHRAEANPGAYGDSVGHWEGDTLVVDVTNFDDNTWFGEGGYFHTDAMHVTERLWLDANNNLVWQATVEDSKVLAAPWTITPRVVKPSNEPLEESARCVEDDGHRLLNNDHHGQR
ncbi:MAG TPA: hypothetical protein VE958_05750 [Bryobacteraceae bacterium]|nr:hypothetical protein [Bryobacteraceae bacterium]